MKVLNGHPYHQYTNEMLKFVIQDASAAAKCAQGLSNIDTKNKYLEQVNDVCKILYYRQKNKKSS